MPIPRGGGLAIVTSSVAAMGLLTGLGLISVRIFIGISGGGIAVALVGILDDRGSLSAGKRLTVHLIAAAWAVVWVGHVSELQLGAQAIRLGVAGYALSVIAIAWFLNIFNFMDGIDGIAASEAVFICGAALLLSARSGSVVGVSAASSAVCAASAGFLLWNWPPAKIFMGDVGSGYLGFVIGVLWLASSTQTPSALWMWLILAGVFVADSSVTLVRRMSRGEQITVAHRTHAYQHLAREKGHLAVTRLVVAIDLLWLLPCAFLSTARPAFAFWFAILALCPLVFSALAAGSGQPKLS